MQISMTLLKPVRAWAEAKYKAFRPNGFGRQYGDLGRIDLGAPDEVWEIKRQVVEANGLVGAEQEPMFKDFCGYITEGGAVHPHTDLEHNGKQHVRFNVLVSKPESGGVPVQDDIELFVEEGSVWKCVASQTKHWCTPVVGSKPRIVLSYGFLL